MIDTHCHLNYPPLADDVAGVLARASEAGVTKVIIPGTDMESSESAVVLAGQHDMVWAGVGIHPSDAHEANPANIDRLRALLMNPKVIAVGEVGLDYFHTKDLKDTEQSAVHAMQELLLREMVSLAREYDKPLIIHSRDCFEDLHAILKDEASGHPTVIHCFTGTMEEAKKWLDLGFYLSFTGILTYKNAAALREVAKEVPMDHLMIETDAPYLAPEGYRGQTCEPFMVKLVAQQISDLRGISLDEVIKHTTSTAEAFFKLP